jgi:hypothetical protein
MTDAVGYVDIGILTKGKPTLGMTLATLLLQEEVPLRIWIVDTAEQPVIKRDDVLFALKLAQDRGIRCEYEYSKERQRAFSVGRLKLLESLTGRHVSFLDDDIVLPSTALAHLYREAQASGAYGYIAPVCVNAGTSRGFLADRPHYSPGGLFFQDSLVRAILLDYYTSTTDVLDTRHAPDKVWELAFLSELFPALGRTITVQQGALSYHLDYHRGVRWELGEEDLLARSRAKVEQMIARHAPPLPTLPALDGAGVQPGVR